MDGNGSAMGIYLTLVCVYTYLVTVMSGVIEIRKKSKLLPSTIAKV